MRIEFWVMTIAVGTALAACGKPAAGEAELAAATTESPSPAVDPALAPAVVEPAFDASAAPAGAYKSDPGHAYITFSYSHMGYSNPMVRWGSWTGDLNWNPSAPEQSSVTATIDVGSVDSGVEKLDNHLRSADFFDAEIFPTIAFKSTSVKLTGLSTAEIAGELTVKDVTKPVTLSATINKAADDAFAKAYKLGFSAEGKLNRSDYDVGLYAPMVGDEVSYRIEAEFVMPKEQAPAQ